ncbi:MAG: hypothetical protein ACLPID_08580 [Beijerinckiaceae bacterium]
MRIFGLLAIATMLAASLSLEARAECHFAPVSFFPDRNDKADIAVTTDNISFCAMKFLEGPGYKFTSATFGKAPPHGVLAQTGPTAFLYHSFDGYHGSDSYSIRICADVRGKSGCSTLTYHVEVR